MKDMVRRILAGAAVMAAAGTMLFAQPKLMSASAKVEYDIEWHLNGGTQNKANPGTYTAEDGLVLAAPTREGYSFEGWYANADLSGDKVTAIQKGETQKKVFYAHWVITKAQAVKQMQSEMVTVIPAGNKVALDDFAGNKGSVTIEAYEIARHEVTQDLYMAVMGYNPSRYKNNPADGEVQEKRPVENVSWNDACDFCNKLSEIMGLTPCYDKYHNCDYKANGFRLPTEEEWEMAARGGVAGGWDYKYAGSDSLDDVAWNIDNSNRVPHEVGKKKPNALGLYDMSGNVKEWCNSWYSDFCIVTRGGACDNSDYCAVSYRDDFATSRDGYSTRGFRIVRNAQ